MRNNTENCKEFSFHLAISLPENTSIQPLTIGKSSAPVRHMTPMAILSLMRVAILVLVSLDVYES